MTSSRCRTRLGAYGTSSAVLVLTLACWTLGPSVRAPVADEREAVASPALDVAHAERFARLALDCLDREFPGKPAEVLSGPGDVRSPRSVHPAFFGCFDWHSSVHGHWMLVRLLRLHPALPSAPRIRERLAAHLTSANIAAETAVLDREGNRSFERPYGWAWLLRLAAEARAFEDPDARAWAAALEPLERKIVSLLREYLPKLTYPVRTGVHPDTAFALAQVLDYADAVDDGSLRRLIVERAKAWYGGDCDYPAAYEPSGEDFFSPGLNEADLMRRVLSASEFSAWLDSFRPGLAEGLPAAWAEPARVSDLSDPKITHLVGLNLSRAWTLDGIAGALPDADPRRPALLRAMRAHEAAGLEYVFSGHYEGEHWLATFAVYHLTGAGRGAR